MLFPISLCCSINSPYLNPQGFTFLLLLLPTLAGGGGRQGRKSEQEAMWSFAAGWAANKYYYNKIIKLIKKM